MNSTIRLNRLRMCFDSLYLKLEDTRAKEAKYCEINGRMNRQMALAHLLEWRDASSTRIQ